VTRAPLSRSKGKGQLVADVLNSQHAGTGATWRINTKILSTCRGRRHIVAAARLQLVSLVFLLLCIFTHVFQPIAMETLGPINESAVQFLNDLGHRITSVSADDKEGQFLFQRLSTTTTNLLLQR